MAMKCIDLGEWLQLWIISGFPSAIVRWWGIFQVSQGISALTFPLPKQWGTKETHSVDHQELDLIIAWDGWGKCHVILSRMLFKSPEDLTGKLGPWKNLTPHLHFIFRRDSPSHEGQMQAWCFRAGKLASVTWGSHILWVLKVASENSIDLVSLEVLPSDLARPEQLRRNSMFTQSSRKCVKVPTRWRYIH